jgi:hypothetical protein
VYDSVHIHSRHLTGISLNIGDKKGKCQALDMLPWYRGFSLSMVNRDWKDATLSESHTQNRECKQELIRAATSEVATGVSVT